MNHVEKPSPPIRVENNVDLDTIDSNFMYIHDNIIGKDVPKPEAGIVGCKCGCVAIGGGAVQLGSLWHARHSARSSGVCTLVIPEIFEQKAAVQLSRREAKRIFNLSFAAEEL